MKHLIYFESTTYIDQQKRFFSFNEGDYLLVNVANKDEQEKILPVKIIDKNPYYYIINIYDIEHNKFNDLDNLSRLKYNWQIERKMTLKEIEELNDKIEILKNVDKYNL